MRKRSGKSLKFYLRLMRHPGTPESVGRGVASGLFSAFITPIGQMPLALLLALLFRGAKGSALLATWVTNPLNMPVVYPVQCYLGSFIIGNPLSYELIKRMVLDALHNPSMKTAWALGGELVACFLAGGILFGLLSAVPGYFLTTEMARRYRARRAGRKELRMNRRKTEEILR
ncbi:MAG: DUF2062 domain-containing protein [Kiritimatiellaceae bacterium]|nr:DUF2062 domain-containing protein [Kiritimatiellaceae bacterium]